MAVNRSARRDITVGWLVSRAAFKAGIADVRQGKPLDERWQGGLLRPGPKAKFLFHEGHIYEKGRLTAVCSPKLKPTSSRYERIMAYVLAWNSGAIPKD